MYDAAKVRALNDEFRTSFTGGRIVATPGVLMLPDAIAILERVKTFTEFDADSDPYGEHDFGAFKQDSDQIFWKIDYYDCDLEQGSPDPTDASVTIRVLTIMLGEDY